MAKSFDHPSAALRRPEPTGTTDPASLQTLHFQAGRGRALALAALALGNLDGTPLDTLRNAQFDQYQRQMPRDIMAELVDRIMAGGPHALGIDILFAEPDRYSADTLWPATSRHCPDKHLQPCRGRTTGWPWRRLVVLEVWVNGPNSDRLYRFDIAGEKWDWLPMSRRVTPRLAHRGCTTDADGSEHRQIVPRST